jgi:peptidoglycan-associated lipoprotein
LGQIKNFLNINAMKITKLIQFLVLGVALTITAVGCKTHPQGVQHIPGERQAVADPNLNGGQPFSQVNGINDHPVGSDIKQASGSDFAGWGEDRASLKSQTVYFDLDKSTIKSSEQSKLNEVASYLKGNPSAALRVEGNCDERGTEEYNRSLGDKRALAAREYLANLGVDPSKIVTLSNGEDKPAAQGHSEAAWSKNRRDEFVVLMPPKP